MILNIETSSKICSVALCDEGATVFRRESDKDMEHSTLLAPYVEECMEYLTSREQRLDAVAVSLGPGSYTGLRIGLSLAKGLCFSKDIPLIGINTLEILAVKGLFRSMVWTGEELFVPMMDARRMEVYTAVYDAALKPLLPPQPLILQPDSYSEFKGHKLVFIGDGVEKAKGFVEFEDSRWFAAYPLASDMMVLSEKAYRERNFIDIAYSVPIYLKNFQATTPKKLF